MKAREYLRRLSEEPETITLDERIEYLEHCYLHDSISSDTRAELGQQIEALKKRRDAKKG